MYSICAKIYPWNTLFYIVIIFSLKIRTKNHELGIVYEILSLSNQILIRFFFFLSEREYVNRQLKHIQLNKNTFTSIPVHT